MARSTWDPSRGMWGIFGADKRSKVGSLRRSSFQADKFSDYIGDWGGVKREKGKDYGNRGAALWANKNQLSDWKKKFRDPYQEKAAEQGELWGMETTTLGEDISGFETQDVLDAYGEQGTIAALDVAPETVLSRDFATYLGEGTAAVKAAEEGFEETGTTLYGEDFDPSMIDPTTGEIQEGYTPPGGAYGAAVELRAQDEESFKEGQRTIAQERLAKTTAAERAARGIEGREAASGMAFSGPIDRAKREGEMDIALGLDVTEGKRKQGISTWQEREQAFDDEMTRIQDDYSGAYETLQGEYLTARTGLSGAINDAVYDLTQIGSNLSGLYSEMGSIFHQKNKKLAGRGEYESVYDTQKAVQERGLSSAEGFQSYQPPTTPEVG